LLLRTKLISSKLDFQASAHLPLATLSRKGMRPPKEPPIARASKKGGCLSGRLTPDWIRIVTSVGMYDSSADALCDKVALLPRSHFARRQPIEAGINLDFCCGVPTMVAALWFASSATHLQYARPVFALSPFALIIPIRNQEAQMRKRIPHGC
jgi:hypothetical protein